MNEASMIAVTWAQMAAATVVLIFAGGVGMIFIRDGLRKQFVSTELFKAHVAALSIIEARINAMPPAAEIHSISRRMAAVEAGIARLSAEVEGVQHGMTRVEKQLEVLTEHLLAKERDR